MDFVVNEMHIFSYLIMDDSGERMFQAWVVKWIQTVLKKRIVFLNYFNNYRIIQGKML